MYTWYHKHNAIPYPILVIINIPGQLDADDKSLVNNHGKKMSRDIVQFVSLRKYARQGDSFSLVIMTTLL